MKLYLILLTHLLTTISWAEGKPNILWITSEDHGPQLGCYGDEFADTPNLDALAKQGLRYDFVWSNAPVCAPARSTLISGLYPTSTGSENMRSTVISPADRPFYPQLLKKAGYYCINNSKTDYNFANPSPDWNDSSPQAHWENAPANQPFFAIFNCTLSHESRIRNQPKKPKHDPAKVNLPAYHPDTPEVRRDWAQYYDTVSNADAAAGRRLEELAAAGLQDSTIVFYYADHGSGMPRSKRWPGNSGLQVPLIVYIPEKFAELRPADYRPGGVSNQLVSFVDFAPTLLSLAGVKPPNWMQGNSFLGEHIVNSNTFLHGFRRRMDEREDLVRSVSNGRFVYIRNYRPDLPAGQYIGYQFKTDTTRIWWERFIAKSLTTEQEQFWLPHPSEELYDLQTDPDEVHNLASNLKYKEIKSQLRNEQQAQARKVIDVGFLPEAELHSRTPGVAPYDFARQKGIYNFESIFATAEIASTLDPTDTPALVASLNDSDSAIRYWAALGLSMRGIDGIRAGGKQLRTMLSDKVPSVAIAAASGISQYGSSRDRKKAIQILTLFAKPKAEELYTPLAALNALDRIDSLPTKTLTTLSEYSEITDTLPKSHHKAYIKNLITHILERN